MNSNQARKSLGKASISTTQCTSYKVELSGFSRCLTDKLLQSFPNLLEFLISIQTVYCKNLRCILESGSIFGELSLLYNCKRSATVKVLTPAVLYQLQRHHFQKIMKHTSLEHDQQKFKLLQSIKEFENLNTWQLKKITDLLEIEKFEDGECICRQGDSGDRFYIIAEGSVRIRREEAEMDTEVLLKKGQYSEPKNWAKTLFLRKPLCWVLAFFFVYFGQWAIMRRTTRSASVYALGKNVSCYSLREDGFTRLIGESASLNVPARIIKPGAASSRTTTAYPQFNLPAAVSLEMMSVVASLGEGSFGYRILETKDRMKKLEQLCRRNTLFLGKTGCD